MHTLEQVAPSFVEMAHRIVWCTVATIDETGAPRTRILHPVWQWDGSTLTGWVATSPQSIKARHLAAPGGDRVSLTYWAPDHDTCTADCTVAWEDAAEERARGWKRFVDAPAPVGYDPKIIPGWDSPDAPAFGILRLMPYRLRVMPSSVMLKGQGELLRWRA